MIQADGVCWSYAHSRHLHKTVENLHYDVFDIQFVKQDWEMLDVICCLNVIILRSRWTLVATQISTLHHRNLWIICCLIQQSIELECEDNHSLEGLYWVGSAFVHAMQFARIKQRERERERGRERKRMGGLLSNHLKAQRQSWSWEEIMFHMYCAKILAYIEDPLWVLKPLKPYNCTNSRQLSLPTKQDD